MGHRGTASPPHPGPPGPEVGLGPLQQQQQQQQYDFTSAVYKLTLHQQRTHGKLLSTLWGMEQNKNLSYQLW